MGFYIVPGSKNIYLYLVLTLFLCSGKISKRYIMRDKLIRNLQILGGVIISLVQYSVFAATGPAQLNAIATQNETQQQQQLPPPQGQVPAQMQNQNPNMQPIYPTNMQNNLNGYQNNQNNTSGQSNNNTNQSGYYNDGSSSQPTVQYVTPGYIEDGGYIGGTGVVVAPGNGLGDSRPGYGDGNGQGYRHDGNQSNFNGNHDNNGARHEGGGEHREGGGGHREGGGGHEGGGRR